MVPPEWCQEGRSGEPSFLSSLSWLSRVWMPFPGCQRGLWLARPPPLPPSAPPGTSRRGRNRLGNGCRRLPGGPAKSAFRSPPPAPSLPSPRKPGRRGGARLLKGPGCSLGQGSRKAPPGQLPLAWALCQAGEVYTGVGRAQTPRKDSSSGLASGLWSSVSHLQTC